MKLKLIIIFLTFPLIASCQALSAITYPYADNEACEESKAQQIFPKTGSKKHINISFSIKDDNHTIPFEKNVTCEYHGSSCHMGKLYYKWWGNRKLKSVETTLSTNNKLSFNEHVQCTHLGEYLKKCNSKNCQLANEFGILVLFSDKNTQIRKSQIKSGVLKKRAGQIFILADRDFMPYTRLGEVGIKIENLKININN